MKTYYYKPKNLETVEDVVFNLTNKNVLHLKKGFTQNDLDINIQESHPETVENLSLPELLNNSILTPNIEYLDFLFKEFQSEIKHYISGKKKGNMEEWLDFKYIEKTQFAVDANEILKIAKKLKKKLIKILRNNPATFLTSRHKEESTIENYFKDYWFNENVNFGDNDRTVNQDVFDYAFSRSNDDTDFDYSKLINFYHWKEVVSQIRCIKILNEKIISCQEEINQKSIKIIEAEHLHNLFSAPIEYYLFQKCIAYEKKVTKRTFSIYYNIFKAQGFLQDSNDYLFIDFIKVEYGITITRVEKEICRDIEKELTVFKKYKNLFFL